MTRFLTALMCGFVLATSVHAQKLKAPRDAETDKQHYEDNRIENAAERLFQPSETERDRFLRETAKLRPADPANEAMKSEVNMIFDRLAGGPEEWTYDVARQRSTRDLFERVAGRLNLVDGKVTRQQFTSYAATYLRPDSSPPFRTAADDEDRAFRQLDVNQDGALDPAEMSATLRESLSRFDTNRNGVVERAEYTGYFAARMDVMAKRLETIHQARAAKEAAKAGLIPAKSAAVASPTPAASPAKTTAASTAASKAPPVEAVRFGHLPRGLPQWFLDLDMDHDGQIGLYEWNRSGRVADAFMVLDDNGDGLMTSEEWLRFERSHPEEAAIATVMPEPTTLVKATPVKALPVKARAAVSRR